MKRLKKIKDISKKWIKTDVVGHFKNILLVGEKNPVSEMLVDSLDPSFNIFSLYNSRKFGESNDVLYEKDIAEFKDS